MYVLYVSLHTHIHTFYNFWGRHGGVMHVLVCLMFFWEIKYGDDTMKKKEHKNNCFARTCGLCGVCLVCAQTQLKWAIIQWVVLK